METLAYGLSDTGPDLELNEDVIVIDNDLGLYMVCDGMGGHLAGEVASQLAADSIHEYLSTHSTVLSSPLTVPGGHSPIGRVIGEAIQRACLAVHRQGESSPALKNMGTTTTLALVTQGRAFIGHVGDSRVYLLRRGDLHQLTTDHTLAQDLIDRGECTPDEARFVEFSRALTRSVGTHPTVRPDLLSLDLTLGDRLLLCSDGLTEAFPYEKGLKEVLSMGKPADIPEEMKKIAYERHTTDNLSVVLVELSPTAASRQADEDRSKNLILCIELLQKMFLFHDFSLLDLTRVLEHCQAIESNAGTVLFEEGEEGDALYVILEGAVEVIRAGRRITTLARGNHVGEMALLVNSPRVAGARTISECRLLKMEHTHFQQLVRQHPTIGVKMLTAISRELSVRLGGALGVIDLLSAHPTM